ncbi:MAG TPA: hypothetical protein VF848_02315, partial [Steroidobacteraceae bacterium]
GPLSNPAEPEFHVIGAYDLATAELMANALAGMSIKRAFVIHGAAGWDEPTPIGPFELFDVRQGQVHRELRQPADYGLSACQATDLAGADAAHNAAALRAVLEGRDRGAHRDALLLSAALALEVMTPKMSPRAALARASYAIDHGAAASLLAALARFGMSRL